MTARDKFREHVAEALTNWRLGCKLHYGDWGPERAVICAGIGEIAILRLAVAYVPLLQGLARIEARVGILADLKSEPYAPKVSGTPAPSIGQLRTPRLIRSRPLPPLS